MCVVAWRADARPALPDPQRPQAVAERLGGILAATIAVEDEPGPRAPAADGRIEHRPGEVGIACPPQRPREDATRVLIEHDRQKAPPPHDRDVRDIPDPDLIGPRGDAGPQPVGMLAVEAMQPGIGAVDLHDPRAQPRRAHEACDPASADGAPLRAQRALDAGTAVGPAVLLEEPLNAPLQLPVLRCVSTLGSLPPRVVAGPGDAVHCTEPRHRVGAPLRVDEREDVSFRVAQNRMAFFKRACSSCRSACARSSAWSRRISRGGGSFTATASRAGPRRALPSATATT